jgi:acetolactate synthase-1/2/3 large subunit
MSRTAARILVDHLEINGVERVFCVPGESYLAVLDALHDSGIEIVVCRHEGGAAIMAEAHGKLTGRPGICLVTRGPGATNASAGVHIAKQDSTPLILFVGQIARDTRERETFQELDYRAVFGTMTKWTTEIDDARRMPELISRAFSTAMNGRPGPVVMALPEDMLTEEVAVTDGARVEPVTLHPGQADMARLADLLGRAERPIAILGGGGWTAAGVADMVAAAERAFMPVATAFRRQMLFPAESPSAAGDLGIGPNPDVASRIDSSDLVIAVGTRLSEMATQGFTRFTLPKPQQPFVHVHADPEEVGRVYQPSLGIVASPGAFAAALNEIAKPGSATRAASMAMLHSSFLAWTEEPQRRNLNGVDMGQVILTLRSELPAEAVITNGAGNFATWVHRYYRFRRFGTQLAPTSGSMGYGFPAALAAAALDRSCPVVCVAGDGDFLMTGQEFATAVQYDLPVIVIIADNGMYGTIRMHQEREYPGRVSGTGLRNPDFAMLARAFGGHGERVETTADFAPAFARARSSGKPAIIHCLVDPEAITPATTLSALREKALAGRGQPKR